MSPKKELQEKQPRTGRLLTGETPEQTKPTAGQEVSELPEPSAPFAEHTNSFTFSYTNLVQIPRLLRYERRHSTFKVCCRCVHIRSITWPGHPQSNHGHLKKIKISQMIFDVQTANWEVFLLLLSDATSCG